MIINYCNTKEDLIEVNKFIHKNRLGKFNKVFYLYIHLRYLPLFSFSVLTLYFYITTNNFSYVSTGIPVSLVLGLYGYTIMDSILGIKLSQAIAKLMKQEPYVLQSKSLELKHHYMRLFNSFTEKTFHLEDICRVVKNEHDIYIFFAEYRDFLVIPYSAFKDEDEKNKFVKKVG